MANIPIFYVEPYQGFFRFRIIKQSSWWIFSWREDCGHYDNWDEAYGICEKANKTLATDGVTKYEN